METLEELKSIVDNAPSDGRATHIDEIGDYIESNDSGDCWFDHLQWVLVEGPVCMRSLSDIKRIIELMDQVKSGYEAYARIEAVKQRYNGESKRKTNILIGAEKLLKGCNTHNCRYLANVIKGALK